MQVHLEAGVRLEGLKGFGGEDLVCLFHLKIQRKAESGCGEVLVIVYEATDAVFTARGV